MLRNVCKTTFQSREGEVIDLHLLRHFRLHFDHGMEKIFEGLESSDFTSNVKVVVLNGRIIKCLAWSGFDIFTRPSSNCAIGSCGEEVDDFLMIGTVVSNVTSWSSL